MGRGTSGINGSVGGTGGFTMRSELTDVVDALGIKQKVNQALSDIDSAKFVLQPASSFAPDVKDYKLKTPYGNGTYWKNPGEDFYRVKIPSDIGAQPHVKTRKEAENLIKNDIKQTTVNNMISDIVYTGTSYGIGNPEYTAVGQQFASVLKKAGFNGV